MPCALLAGPSVDVSGQEAAPAVRMVADEGEGAKYWPRWRGPSGQGLVSGAGYPDAWSPTQNVRWKTPLSGDGNSSPIVWGDRIFLTTAYDNGRRVSVDRVSAERWHEAVGGVRARRPIGSGQSLQERPRLGDAGDRRPARLRLVRRSRSRRLGHGRQAGLASRPRADGGVSRHRRLAAALQGPHHPLSGSVRRVVHRRVRHAHRQGGVAHEA